MSKQQIKFGINFPEIGAIKLMTVKLRYATSQLTGQCLNDIQLFSNRLKELYGIQSKCFYTKDYRYITLEFACINNTMVLHEVQQLQYDILRRRLDRRFHLMHQVNADMEAAEMWQRHHDEMQHIEF